MATRHPLASLKLPRTLVGRHDVDENVVALGRLEAAQFVLQCGKHASTLLGDDHFGGVTVEAGPEARVGQLNMCFDI